MNIADIIGSGSSILMYRTEFELAIEAVGAAYERRRQRLEKRKQQRESALEKIDFSKGGDLLAKAAELRAAMREEYEIDAESFAEIRAAQERALKAFPSFAASLDRNIVRPRRPDSEIDAISNAFFNNQQRKQQ